MLNKVILMGRLTADPDLKQTQSGVNVVSFSIAVDRDYSNGEEKQTDFINIVAWRQTAEFISKYFLKGRMIAVEGSLQTRNYTDGNGNKRNITEVLVDRAYFADSKAGKNEEKPTASTIEDVGDFEEISDDEELPW